MDANVAGTKGVVNDLHLGLVEGSNTTWWAADSHLSGEEEETQRTVRYYNPDGWVMNENNKSVEIHRYVTGMGA
jgi:hypothetical protein